MQLGTRLPVTRLSAIAALSTLAAGTVGAHHSSALFTFNKRVTVEGTVVGVAWQNPHVYITIESRGRDGNLMRQDIQAASVSMIKTFGVTREMLAPGTHVKVDAAAQRSGADHLLWGGYVTFDDGSVYLLETAGPNTHIPGVPAATSLAGNWVPPPTSIQAFVQTIGTLPLAQAASAGRAVLGDPRLPASSCESGLPPIAAAMLGALPVLHSLEIGEQSIAIRVDTDIEPVERTVHLDQATHPAGISTRFGHSIGHWDGATLVIDTAGFPSSPVSSAALHTVERLTLAKDKRHLLYQVTLDDSTLWTHSVSLSVTWDYRPDVEASGASCNSKNARRYLQDLQLNGVAPANGAASAPAPR